MVIAKRLNPGVTAVALDGADATKLRLTISARIADGTQNVTLEYDPPSGAKVRDAAGNDAEGFTGGDALDVSVTPDTTAPTVASARIDGATLTVTFDEPLDESSVPGAPGGFTVTVTRAGSAVSGHTVSAVAVAGAAVTLTLAKGVLADDTVTLAYPENGRAVVARVRFARYRSNRPGWVSWSERRSSIPRSSTSGWLSNAITRSKARDGSSSACREANTPASPGSSSSIHAGNHAGVTSCSRACSWATRHACCSDQSGKFEDSIIYSNTSGARRHRANHVSIARTRSRSLQ